MRKSYDVNVTSWVVRHTNTTVRLHSRLHCAAITSHNSFIIDTPNASSPLKNLLFLAYLPKNAMIEHPTLRRKHFVTYAAQHKRRLMLTHFCNKVSPASTFDSDCLLQRISAKLTLHLSDVVDRLVSYWNATDSTNFFLKY